MLRQRIKMFLPIRPKKFSEGYVFLPTRIIRPTKYTLSEK